jgi:hypothetical protein
VSGDGKLLASDPDVRHFRDRNNLIALLGAVLLCLILFMVKIVAAFDAGVTAGGIFAAGSPLAIAGLLAWQARRLYKMMRADRG